MANLEMMIYLESSKVNFTELNTSLTGQFAILVQQGRMLEK